MATISESEKIKAVEFTIALNNLLDFVESVLPHINEQQYIEQMNNLKKLNDNKITKNITQIVETITNRVRENPLVVNQMNRSNMIVRRTQRKKTDAQKLASGHYKVCNLCDRIIHKHYMFQHKETDVCIRINQTKSLTKTFKKKDTAREQRLITAIKGWGAKTYRGCFYK